MISTPKGSGPVLTWERLLSNWRCAYADRPAGPSSPNPYRTDFESDYDRIVYSQPFRRLARKTQVHPMAVNDHVHNRLTHSIEVASVGRSFGRRLANWLAERQLMPAGRDGNDLVWILMASCAAHDIGNPPFGHAGEAAIRDWAASHESVVFPHDLAVSDGLRRDVLLFEGNAQGFRLAARTDNPLVGYLRLTYATLGAMVKYPWASTDQRAAEREKYNCFSCEKEIFHEVFEHLGLCSGGDYLRHPLSFLSEAADDICYRVLDLEDAAELRIIPEARVRDIYAHFLGDTQSVSLPLSQLRGQVVHRLIDESWRVFVDDYASIMAGARNESLKASFDGKLKIALQDVQNVYDEIFADLSKVATELGAFKALGRILKALCNATGDLARAHDPATLRFVSQRCLDLAWPKQYVEQNAAQPYEWWLHQVLDFISGLTDNYARHISREIEGT
jgi:dGTPase